MAFLKQKLIYAKNVWFNLVFGSFFEQDRQLNLIILGVCAKRCPKCARMSKPKDFKTETDVTQNLIDDFYS